jgi:uncharacterized protein (TIGR02001 family)
LIVALLASHAGAETRIYGALASNYVFRGISTSGERASAGAGVDWQHRTGLYAGGNVSSLARGVEIDGYAGFTRRVGLFAFDLGTSRYEYTSDRYGDGAFREWYAGGQAGPVGVTVYRGRSPFGGTRYWYGQLDASWPQGPVTLELHYGVSDYGAGERISDQSAGFAAHWRGLDWRVRITHREASDDDADLVAAISKTWTVNR